MNNSGDSLQTQIAADVDEVRGKLVHIISSFPPARCGVATYADQQRTWFTRMKGVVVSVGITEPANVDIHMSFETTCGLVRWLWFCASTRFQVVYLHFVDGYLFPPSRGDRSIFHFLNRMLSAIGLWILGQRAGVHGHLVIHEIAVGTGISPMNRLLRHFAFASFRSIECHAESNRSDLLRAYPKLDASRVLVKPPRHMVPFYAGTKAEARAALSLPETDCLLLCLGLIAPSKGVDVAIRAFLQARPGAATLQIVGSVGVENTHQDYLGHLNDLCAGAPNIGLHLGFLSDEQFDCWIQAADAVVLAYRNVMSSGVGARAALFGKKLIISNLPALRENFPRAMVFQDESQLTEIFRAIGKECLTQPDCPRS